MAETIVDYLERAGVCPEGGLRFVDGEERATWVGWGEVRAEAEAVARRLRAAGLAPGERAALVYPTGLPFFLAFFGTLLAGGVPVPLYPPVRLGKLGEYLARTARMIEAAGARIVVADSRVKRILGEAVAAARPDLGCVTLDELPPADAADSGPLPRPAPADLGLVQFSSGTTVDPKPVALSHRALVAETEILNGFFLDTPERKHSAVSWLPLYHDMGLIGCVFPALSRDASLTLLGPELFVARPALWLRALSRYRGTISPAPNFGYALCLHRVTDAEMEGVDLSSWETALNGAEAVAPAVLAGFCDRFARWGFKRAALTPVYGLSEAALAVTFSDLGRPFQALAFDRDALTRDGRAVLAADGREIASVGRPVPGFSLRIVDEDGLELPADRVGRIRIAGPSLMDGYLGRPEDTARAFPDVKGADGDRFLDTGDLGFLHGGELYLTGRAKDVVIRRGQNYAPDELERAVDALPGVRTGCVAAASWLPEGAEGETVVLFVETARGASPAVRAALPEACRTAVLAATGVAVDRVELLPPGTLPRTSSGKLRRGEALRLYLADELAPPAPVTPLRLAGALARSRWAFARFAWKRRKEA